MTGRFEILEHTADVGIRAIGETPEEVFEAAAEGLASLLGAWAPGRGEWGTVTVERDDRESLLVGWLDELVYIHDARDRVFGGFEVSRLDGPVLHGRVRSAPRGDRSLEGTGVKAATYHRLRFAREANGGWSADVYLDV